jgi:holo-[acyl-carrier protein] synthase
MKEIGILGIGVDIEDIGRFRKLQYKKNKSFYGKIFTKREIAYCLKRRDSYPSFAVRFAAKEAIVKSLPISPNFQNIEILMRGKKPYVHNYKNIFISLSHEKEKALAFAIRIGI